MPLRILIFIFTFTCLPFALLQARQTTASQRPATPALPANRNSAYDDAIAKARALAAQKDFKAAATASEQAIQMDDKRWEGYIVAAEAYSGQHLYDDAIGMLEMALVRAPADKKPAVRDAISETRKLLLPSPKTTLPQAPARGPAPASSNDDNGPSLGVTMKFIQDKLNELGPIEYTETWRGKDISIQESTVEFSKVSADPKTCLVSLHLKMGINTDGKNDVSDSDGQINLKDVKKIMIVSEEQLQNQIIAQEPAWISYRISVVPPVRVLLLLKAEDWRYPLGDFLFLDDDLANRMAKAFAHAVELCTPDRESEPF
jgi:hypothetical protein